MRHHEDQPGDRPDDLHPSASSPAPAPTRFATGTRDLTPLLAPLHAAPDEVAHLVHDLKNPLMTIALELMILERADVPCGLRAQLDRIQANVGFLDRLVHEILDAKSQEAGALALQKEATDIRALLERLVERSVPTRDRARVVLDGARDVLVDCDPLRIERVVCNLLHNALKYSPATARVLVHLAIRPRKVRISVIDAGPGLDEEAAAAVFEPFVRGRSTHEGHGLGLFLSRRIVEAHGGRLGLRTTPGVGSCFYLELPR